MATFWRRTREQVAKLALMEQEVVTLNQDCGSLESNIQHMHQVPRGSNEKFGAAWEKKIAELYEKLRKTPKEDRSKPINNTDICQYTKDYMEENTRKSHDLFSQIQQIVSYKQHVVEFQLKLEPLQSKILVAKDHVSKFQRQRQNDIWGLFRNLSEHAKSVDMSDSRMASPMGSMAPNTPLPPPQTVPIRSIASPPPPPASLQPSMSLQQSIACNSLLVIEKSHEESMSLRNESITNIQSMKETISNVETFVSRGAQVPNWDFLEPTTDSFEMQEC